MRVNSQRLESRAEDKPLLQLQACRRAGTEPPGGPRAARRIQRCGHPPGKAPCSGVTAKSRSSSLSACGATRPREKRTARTEDQTETTQGSGGGPATTLAPARQPGQPSAAFPGPAAHAPRQPAARPAWPLAGVFTKAWRPAEAAARVRRRAADGWI